MDPGCSAESLRCRHECGPVGRISGWLDAGNDFLQGDAGDDVLIGGSGNDRLYGDNQDEFVIDEGDDWLDGGDGDDQLFAAAVMILSAVEPASINSTATKATTSSTVVTMRIR